MPVSKKMEMAIYRHMKEAELIPPPGAKARAAALRRLGISNSRKRFVDVQLAKAMAYLKAHLSTAGTKLAVRPVEHVSVQRHR